MKNKMIVIAAAVELAAAMVFVAADARATDRFSGGRSDGYCQSEVRWIAEFTSGSRFKGGGFDGYCTVTVQGAMLLPPPRGSVILIH